MRQKPRMISLRLQKWNHLFRLQKTEWKIPKMWVFQLTLNLNKTFKKLKTKKNDDTYYSGKWKFLSLMEGTSCKSMGKKREKTLILSSYLLFTGSKPIPVDSLFTLLIFTVFNRIQLYHQSMWILTQQPSCQCKCWFAWNNPTITQRNWSATIRVRKL